MFAMQRQVYTRSVHAAFGRSSNRFLVSVAPLHFEQQPQAPLPKAPETRAHFGVPAADDFVKDYRELAKLPIWASLLNNRSDNFRVLDTCCGTGRWAQAFSELVVKDAEVPCDFVDLCEDSIKVLGERLEGISNLSEQNRFTGSICDLTALAVPTEFYDAITNMHGLYGIPKEHLPAALQAMYEALKVGGTMIISIGTDKSPYQQVPHQVMGTPTTNDMDIINACDELGINASLSHITYSEEYAANDNVGLERFLFEECGGNCFPTDVALKLDFSIQDYANSNFNKASQMYQFQHQIAIITVVRT